MTGLSGQALLAGVMGWPVAHSRSPALHGHWIARYRLDAAYVPLAVAPERLGEALKALPALGFRGCNLTLPHKEAALVLVNEADEEARRIGAVNTVIVSAEGRLLGRNTDGYGFLANVRSHGSGARALERPAVVIGAGGAARAVVDALVRAGVPEIRVVNRTVERARALAAAMGGPTAAAGWGDRASALEGAGLLVNTSTLGMAGQPALDLALDRLPATALVTDCVYTPLETPLLAAAAARGNPTLDGLGMLLWQAAPGFEAWFGVEPEVDAELRAAVLGAGHEAP